MSDLDEKILDAIEELVRSRGILTLKRTPLTAKGIGLLEELQRQGRVRLVRDEGMVMARLADELRPAEAAGGDPATEGLSD